MDPTIRWVRELPGEWYLLREVATALGISARVLRRWASQHPDLAASHSAQRGSTRVHLYSPADVERLRAYATDTTRVLPPTSTLTGGNLGVPVLWTPVEQLARRRGHKAAYYWRRKANRLEAAGDAEAAATARALAAQIRADLAAAHRTRRRERVNELKRQQGIAHAASDAPTIGTNG